MLIQALILLGYLLENGSDQIVSWAKKNLHVIKTLKEFQYVDEEGRDQGRNVRERCKEITALLTDESKLQQLRANRGGVRDANHTGRYDTTASDEDADLRRAIDLSKRQAEIDERRRQEGLIGGGAYQEQGLSSQE